MAAIRRTGPKRCILSTDMGQHQTSLVAEGFASAEAAWTAGFTVDQIRRMRNKPSQSDDSSNKIVSE